MANFCASLWNEEPTPENLINCSECGLDKHGSRMVWGEGNPHAPLLILLDNPGAREDREGKPFLCGTRQTLQKAAFEAGFQAEDLYVTYVLKRKPVRKYDKERTRQICMNHLKQQLELKHPQLIVCLGNIAVQSFFENNDTDVKSLRGKIHEVHGYKTIAAYHPLAVRRRPNLWPLLLADFKLAAAHFFNKRPVS
ncbi:uracil-DNA glycosylase [Neobacillus sp. YIM B06451]|uniref:uracil-DNA glycosylase n=1 Tax=Neobacillus sp. YIM B06451 TaxID=3070994 RepID=UPI00292E112A|nr:uracil-DNA glycosylase [Neobacillus sp. YIM B06451]